MISSGQTTNSPSVQLSQMVILCRAETLFVSHSEKFLQNSFCCNSLTRMITVGNSGQKQSWCEWALAGASSAAGEHWFPRWCFRGFNSAHLAFKALEIEVFKLLFAVFSLVPFFVSLFHHNRNIFIVNSPISEEENWGPLGRKLLFY